MCNRIWFSRRCHTCLLQLILFCPLYIGLHSFRVCYWCRLLTVAYKWLQTAIQMKPCHRMHIVYHERWSLDSNIICFVARTFLTFVRCSHILCPFGTLYITNVFHKNKETQNRQRQCLAPSLHGNISSIVYRLLNQCTLLVLTLEAACHYRWW